MTEAAPATPAIVLRSFGSSPAYPVIAAFDDGTMLLTGPDVTIAGPLAREHAEHLAALRDTIPSFTRAPTVGGCFPTPGLDFAGLRPPGGDVHQGEVLRASSPIREDLVRKARLAKASLVVVAARIDDGPRGVFLRIDEVLRAGDGEAAPGAMVRIGGPADAVMEDLPPAVWMLHRRPVEAWESADLAIDVTRRDAAWLAAQPPKPVVDALAEKARAAESVRDPRADDGLAPAPMPSASSPLPDPGP